MYLFVLRIVKTFHYLQCPKRRFIEGAKRVPLLGAYLKQYFNTKSKYRNNTSSFWFVQKQKHYKKR